MEKDGRRGRELVKEPPAVADAFLQRRRAEEERALKQRQMLAEEKEREKRVAKAIQDRDAAVAELKKCRKNNSRSRKHSSIRARY